MANSRPNVQLFGYPVKLRGEQDAPGFRVKPPEEEVPGFHLNPMVRRAGRPSGD